VRFTVTPATSAFDLFVYRLFRILRTKEGVDLKRDTGTVTFLVPKEREKAIEAFLEGELLQGMLVGFTKEG